MFQSSQPLGCHCWTGAGEAWDALAGQGADFAEPTGSWKVFFWEESLKLMGNTANSALGCILW